MRLLILLVTLLGLGVTTPAATVPIKGGKLQSDLNAGGYSITNLAGLTDVNGAPLSTGTGSGTVGLVSSNDSSIRITPSVISTGITNFGLDVNTNVIASVAAMNGRISSNDYRLGINVTNYGYVADGVKLYSVALTNSVITAPGAQFTAADIGKVFMAYTDSTNRGRVISQIITVSNSTVALASNNISSTTIAGREGWYGTDNTIALSNCLASTTGDAVIDLPPGVAMFNRTHLAAGGVYSVIDLPNASYVTTTNRTRTIVIRGQSPAVIYPWYVNNANTVLGYPVNGTILFNVSAPVSGMTNVFMQHHAEGPDYYFGQERFSFERLTIRQPVDPKFHALWMRYAGTFNVKDVSFDVDTPPSFLDSSGNPIFFPTNYVQNTNWAATSAAIWGPDFYNYAGFTLQNVIVSYYGLGIRAGEHTVASGNLSFAGCGVALYLDATAGGGGYTGTHTGISAESAFFFACQYPILVSSRGAREVAWFGNLKFECTGGHNTLVDYHIKDPANVLSGQAGIISGTDTPLIQSTKFGYYDAINYNLKFPGGGTMVSGVISANGGSLTNLSTNSSPSLAASIQGAVSGKLDATNGTALNLTVTNTLNIYGNAGELIQIAAGDIATTRTNGRIEGFNFIGNGSLVSNLNASLLESGTVPAARLPVAYTNVTLFNSYSSGTHTNTGNFDQGISTGRHLTMTNGFIYGYSGTSLRSQFDPVGGRITIGSSSGSADTWGVVSDSTTAAKYGGGIPATTPITHQFAGSGSFSASVTASNTITATNGYYFPSNGVTVATVAGGMTNGASWMGMMSNALQAAWMSNNVVTWKIIAP